MSETKGPALFPNTMEPLPGISEVSQAADYNSDGDAEVEF